MKRNETKFQVSCIILVLLADFEAFRMLLQVKADGLVGLLEFCCTMGPRVYKAKLRS